VSAGARATRGTWSAASFAARHKVSTAGCWGAHAPRVLFSAPSRKTPVAREKPPFGTADASGPTARARLAAPGAGALPHEATGDTLVPVRPAVGALSSARRERRWRGVVGGGVRTPRPTLRAVAALCERRVAGNGAWIAYSGSRVTSPATPPDTIGCSVPYPRCTHIGEKARCIDNPSHQAKTEC
jgi:hypothetical protein